MYRLLQRQYYLAHCWCLVKHHQAEKDTRPPTERGPGSAGVSYLLPGQPDVLKLSVHPVTGHGLVVAEARRAHFETRGPEARDPPGFLDRKVFQIC